MEVPTFIAFAEDVLVAYTQSQSGDHVVASQIELYLPFALLKHYHINLADNSILLTHTSKLGQSATKRTVFTLHGPKDEPTWCQQTIMRLDRRILDWFRFETARKQKGFLEFAGVDLNDSEDANVLLMDRRAARVPGGVDAAVSEIFGTRFIARWILRANPKKMTNLVENSIDCLLIPASQGVMVLVAGLGLMFALYWREIYSFGGVKERLVLDHRMQKNQISKFVFNFAFDLQGELCDKVMRGLLNSSVQEEKTPFPQTYPPAQFVSGLRSRVEMTLEQDRFRRIQDRRSKRLSGSLQGLKEADELATKNNVDRNQRGFTAVFLAGAINIPEDDDDDNDAFIDPFAPKIADEESGTYTL